MAQPRQIDFAAVGRVAEELFPEALGVWVYGSHADGTARRGSDLDVAILADRPLDRLDLFRRGQELALRLSQEVDLVDLRSVSTVLRYEVIARGVRVAARDAFSCDLYETAIYAMYQRLNESQREHLADIAARGGAR